MGKALKLAGKRQGVLRGEVQSGGQMCSLAQRPQWSGQLSGRVGVWPCACGIGWDAALWAEGAVPACTAGC